MNEKCSTPEFGHDRISLNFNLSEIIQRNKNNRKKLKSKENEKQQQGNNNAYDPFLDSDYETLDVREIRFEESIADDDQANDRFIFSENSGSINSSPLSIQLFRSPISSEKNADNHYRELFPDSLEELDTPLEAGATDDPIISSPEFQLRFRYSTQFETYSRPGFKKRKLSPSQISFSPKWKNPVPSKFDSPSKIPWAISSSDPNSLTGKKISAEKPSSKYTHLRVKDKNYKKLLSPTRKLAPDPYIDKTVLFFKRKPEAAKITRLKTLKLGKNRSENRNATVNRADNDNGSKAEASFGRNKSHDVQKSKLSAVKRVRSPRHDVENFEIEPGVTFENNSELAVLKDRNLSRNESTVKNKSKVRIISVEVIRDERIRKMFANF